MRIQSVCLTSCVLLACAGADGVSVGGNTGNQSNGGAGGGAATNGSGGGTQVTCLDDDHDNVTTCANDCDDHDDTVKPGGTEVADGKDNDCDGKKDNHIKGKDFDHDGANFGETDCNDDEPLVGPFAIE